MNPARAAASLLFASALLATAAPGVAVADESSPLATPVVTAKGAADDDDAAGLVALLAGAVAALVPLAIGATIADRGKDDAAKDVGLVVAGAGVALAPLAAHATAGEWKRAAAFSAVPVASEIAIAILLASRPDAVYHGTKITRTAFGALFSVDLFIAAIGVVDASFAGDRRKERAAVKPAQSAAPRLRYFAPTVAGGGFGITLGGSL
ncbi:MAG: hypothetical protein ABJE95_37065 [Byssovorax sp.]